MSALIKNRNKKEFFFRNLDTRSSRKLKCRETEPDEIISRIRNNKVYPVRIDKPRYMHLVKKIFLTWIKQFPYIFIQISSSNYLKMTPTFKTFKLFMFAIAIYVIKMYTELRKPYIGLTVQDGLKRSPWIL